MSVLKWLWNKLRGRKPFISIDTATNPPTVIFGYWKDGKMYVTKESEMKS